MENRKVPVAHKRSRWKFKYAKIARVQFKWYTLINAESIPEEYVQWEQ